MQVSLSGDLPEAYKYCQPYLKNLWMGYPFSYEYNRARGHTYALHDVLDIDRIDRYSEKAGLPSTCYNCKTTKMLEWVPQHGDDFWAMEFNEFREKLDLTDHAIGCATCHDPQTMDLRIPSVPLDEALRRQGKDWREASRNQMRALVCAQCHVEYYFQDPALGAAAKPIFPWDMGMDPENIYEYYKDHGSTTRAGFEAHFSDWTHPVSDTPMIKIQHPEYEMWHDGPHGAPGVTCADCHMPYRRLDGEKKISSHLWTSSLKSADGIKRSCGQCHAENSAGFHNPAKALETLARSQQYSQQATNYAMQATQYPIAEQLEGDIKEIVPPIKAHSRKLQQSREHLESHPWLRYLPLLPEAELLWDLNKRVAPKAN